MPVLKFLAAFVGLLASAGISAAAQQWYGQLQGQTVQAGLMASAGQLSGWVSVQGYRYQLHTQGQGGSYQGVVIDQAGGQIPALVSQQGNVLQLKVYTNGPQAMPLSVQLRPAALQQHSQASPAGQLDPALIGRWVYSESYSSGEHGFGYQNWVQLDGNGFVFSAEQSFGGGPGVNVIGGQQPGSAARWQVQVAANGDRHLYINEGGGWQLYGRYYIEAGRMLITLANGEKEFWRRAN
ncbi:MAG: hypothetical protein OIF35_07995 [Cellvibrionaceae bacterium]|nr:hypothetical protein [Cellvibrionaceae bacterium]MCV6624536.1 hypothetical protein [Cellvibrionaceae bacterium]